MKDKRNGIISLVGKTPIIRLSSIEKYYGVGARLFAKIERVNPSGSVKDRAALFMVENAVERGLIYDGVTVVEPTSGNMGISLAMLSSFYGYHTVIIMPEDMSCERVALIRAYGGEVILTDANLGMCGAIALAVDMSKGKSVFMPSQFTNTNNTFAHYITTGREIYDDMQGMVDVFVSGVGTGGSLIGAGRYLKEQNKHIRLVAVEPRESAVISGGYSVNHGIQGIGAGFIPPLYDGALVDEVVSVDTDGAVAMTRQLAIREGVLVGISSGAALCGAINVGKREENTDKNIVVLFPDGGEKYLSISGCFFTT